MLLEAVRPIFFCLIIQLLLSCGQDAENMNDESSIETVQVESQTPTSRIAVDVGIIVPDMERSLGFYRDIIGLAVINELTTSLIGKGRMVQLEHGASLIKLVQMEKAPSHNSPAGLTSAVGYRYITLMVSDLDAIIRKIEAAKVPIALPVTTLGNGTRIVMVEDPDGNIVEFVQEAIEGK